MIYGLSDLAPLADLIALKPASYALRILICISAFIASLNVEKTVSPVIGFVVILLSGQDYFSPGLPMERS